MKLRELNTEFLACDLKSGLVVSLIALPLCLGIALASGAPLISGLISGILGGLVIGSLSQSQVSVSGPAAGLAVVVLTAIQDLASFPLFLCSVFIAGLLQFLFGLGRLGRLTQYFSPPVIEGLLSAIGILIILKQLPYALGVSQFTSAKDFTEQFLSDSANRGALLIGIVCLLLLISYNTTPVKNAKSFKWLPISIFLVLQATFIAWMLERTVWALHANSFVNIGQIQSLTEIPKLLQYPDFANIFQFKVFKHAFIISIIASIETLLCIEAGTKLDPLQRTPSKNRELKAQGIGNMIAGCIGGLPMTSVIVRTSVNIQSGAKTQLSTVIHGLFLLVCVIFIPHWINSIPLAALACILLSAGFNLAHPKILLQMLRKGRNTAIPFFTTIIITLFTDLLTGVLVGQMTAWLCSETMYKRNKTSH